MDTEIRIRLRAEMSARRAALGAAERIAAAEGVARSLERLPEFMVDANVAGYWAVRGELPLNLAVASLHSRGQHYLLPVLDGDSPRGLQFARYRTGDALKANRFGIPEPRNAVAVDARQLDLVLLPLLAFDARGNRLGTGGGFYDTTFSFLRDRPAPARPLLVGIGYAFQQVESLTAEDWDVALDYVATERELIACFDG
jgi:5-formyltetrahydrofolate cyclo-ligase